MPFESSSRARLMAALLATTCAIASPAWAQTVEVAFDIPAQGLAPALNAFSRQAGVQILFPYDAVEGRTSKALKGRYTPREGLNLLLAGSPLVVGTDNGRTIGLVVPKKPGQGQGQVSGLVRQIDSQAPLSGVLVKVDDQGQTAVTDSEGRYRFGALATGAHNLTFQYLGLPDLIEAVDIAPGENAQRVSVMGGQVSEVVVTGQRAAQARALSHQRNADNLSNIVAADQAGRFPDLNAAEALRRMPGVSVQREVVAGEGRYVSIRGLDSGLNNTQINGMNAAQPEKESRRVPLDMIQTSALSSITVHKTLLPDQDADGIGGAVVLETATAFDFAKPVLDLTVSGFHHDLAGKTSPMFQGTAARRFGDHDQFGVLISGGYSKRSTKGYVFYNDEDYLSFVEDDPSQGVTPLQYHIAQYEDKRENISANVALNWAISDNTQLTFKGSYNRLYDQELSKEIYFEAGTDEYDDDGKLILTEGGHAEIFDQYEETELTQQSYVLTGRTQYGAFTFDYGLGYSAGLRNEPFDNEVAFKVDLDSNLYGYDFSGRFPQPNLTAADQARIADPSQYELGYNDIDIDDQDNTRTAAHIDVTYAPNSSWLREVKFGAKAERSKRTLVEGNVMDLQGPLTLQQFGVGPLVDVSKTGAPYPAFLSLDINQVKAWKTYSQHLVATNPDFENDYVEDGAIPRDADSYQSREDIFAGYLMAKGVWGRWEAIGGLRLDHTRIASDNWEAVALEGEDPTFTPVTGKARYTSWLPRLQINYRPNDDLVVRGSFFTSIARPEPLFISGATEIEEEDGEVDVTVGNPGLKPAYAYNFDLGVERYFGSIGMVSAGVYYKRIERFIYSGLAGETEADRSRFENDPRLVGKDIDDVITYTNGKRATVYGLELNLVRQFNNLPGPWGGLGIYANATLQHSEADPGVDDIAKGPFFNAPEQIYTAAATYQKYGLEGTLAYGWRSSQAVVFSSYGTRITEEPYGSLDGQLRYAITPRAKVFVNAVDILNGGDKPIVDQRYGAGASYLEGSTYSGRTVTFGLNMSF